MQDQIQNASEHFIIKACVGLHPWNTGRYSDEVMARLKDLVRHPEVTAVSEIGLDYVGRMSEGKFVNEFADKEIARDRNRIIYGFWKSGKTVDEIALSTGIPRGTVTYYVCKFNRLASQGLSPVFAYKAEKMVLEISLWAY